jgi:histidinol phosphatase-like PHP family hydrolase
MRSCAIPFLKSKVKKFFFKIKINDKSDNVTELRETLEKLKMLKVAHINKERIISANDVKDFVKKLNERQRQRAYKMLMQE